MNSQKQHSKYRHLMILLAGIVVGLVLAVPAAAFADVDEYVVGVNGMACPFCAYGVEKKLKDIDGVSELTIRIKDGEVDVPVDQTVTPAQIQTAIKKAGFELRDLSVSGTGDIRTAGDTRTESRAIIEFSPGFSLPIANYNGKAGRYKVTGTVVQRGSRWVVELDETEAL
jgi:mercuric ion binding protein